MFVCSFNRGRATSWILLIKSLLLLLLLSWTRPGQFSKKTRNRTPTRKQRQNLFPPAILTLEIPLAFIISLLNFPKKMHKRTANNNTKVYLAVFCFTKILYIITKMRFQANTKSPRNGKKRRLATGVWVFHVKEWRYTIIRSVFSAFQHGRKL